MRKIITAATAAALMAVPSFAQAATGTPPVVDSWVWGGVVTSGQCRDGMHPVYSEVPNFNTEARFWIGWGDQRRVHQTWADVVAAGLATSDSNSMMWGYEFNAGRETTLPEGTPLDPQRLYEGDCVPDGYTLPDGQYNGGGTPVPAVQVYKHWDAVYSTKITRAKTHLEVVPAKTHTEPIYRVKVTNPIRSFQVDTYTPKTKAQADVINQLVKSGVLPYRGDRALWGRSTWSFKNLNAAQAATYRPGTAVIGKPITVAWCLGYGAKPGVAWGPKHNVVQTIAAKCTFPKPVTTRVQVGTRTVIDVPSKLKIVIDQPEKRETVLVTPERYEMRTIPASELDAYLKDGWYRMSEGGGTGS